MRNILRKGVIGVSLVHLFTLSLLLLASCSEEDTTEDEYANWQERNDNAVKEWAANNAYTKILTYTKETTTPGLENKDYIYVEVLEKGNGTESPLYSDTCRVAYRGRLIPTTSYKDGYVFDETFLGEFDWKTCGTTDFCANNIVRDGFSTALQNMHIGDRWRVRFSYSLGYGANAAGTIPAYSDLIFDIALLDFWHPGEQVPNFKSR
ncbi:MAG: FKBP-type peptidyl-prolyl cis-trans isomerase [Prevotella sp.]|nr:FKBP-type peptidyl-prolyl cis-trans isomerase [Prevotella sp.]